MGNSERSLSISVTKVAARQPFEARAASRATQGAGRSRPLLRIVGLPAQRELCVCDLEELLGISQSMTSHHIGVLRRAHLLLQRREERDVRWAYYRLNPEAIENLKVAFNGLMDLSGFDSTPASCA